MSNNLTLEQRLATIEQTVADLQLQINVSASSNWLDKITGLISDETAFLEALEYGQLLRHADKPMGEVANEVAELASYNF
jgi:hypothetical protein